MRNRKNIKLKNTSEQRNIKQSEESSPKISVVEREKRKITFNFSFMTSNKNYNLDSENFKEDVGIKFCKRLKELSDSQFTSLLAMNKNRGLETLKISDLSSNDKIKKWNLIPSLRIVVEMNCLVTSSGFLDYVLIIIRIHPD